MDSCMEDGRHLSRLPRPFYQAFAVVHWIISIHERSQGWLDDRFHWEFREMLLHASVREALLCPIYVLMPDHMHMIWMGTQTKSDQINGMRFLRRQIQLLLKEKSKSSSCEFLLQKQSYDRVLREEQRKQDAFQSTCLYIMCNPFREGLSQDMFSWRWMGCMVPGYPLLEPWKAEFWPLFWKHFANVREAKLAPPLPRF